MNEIINFNAESKISEDTINLFKWHDCKESMEMLIDPKKAIISEYKRIINGNRLHIKLKLFFGIIKIVWIAEIENVVYGKEFTDVQITGPFKYWVHRHYFKSSGNPKYSIMRDEINFSLPGGNVVNCIFGKFILWKLKRVFQARHKVLKNEFGEYQHSLD